MSNHSKARRDFLRATSAAIACGGASAFVPQLGLIGPALAASLPGYRALVCVYLAGGNDSWNMLMPVEQSAHDLYVASRNGLYDVGNNPDGLAIPHPTDPNFVSGQTLPRALALNGGQYSVNPFAPELQTLFNESKLGFIANIGTLVDPLTRAQYDFRDRPPQLFSHNDQTSLWQIGSGSSTQGSQGWGGMVAGAVALPSANTAGLPPALSIAGQTRFLIGQTGGGAPLFPFALSVSATTPASTLQHYGSNQGGQFRAVRRAALDELLAASTSHLFATEHGDILERSIVLAENVINPAVQAIPSNDPVNGGGSTGFTWPTGNNLATQLQQVARMIKISRTTGTYTSSIAANRQVFFVNAGGYDTHDNQIGSATAASGHHALLQQLAQAVFAFQRAMEAMGADDDVTLFTMSEFARTINSNGNGSDHAWGGVQFALGGQVNGGAVYGRYPAIALDNVIGGARSVNPAMGESLARGQFLPTTAVDQFGATMARWMGVADSGLPAIFPNIDNFVTGPYASVGQTSTFAYFNRTIPGLMVGV